MGSVRSATFYEDAFLRAFPMVLDEADAGVGYLPPERRARIAWTNRSLAGFGSLLGLAEFAGEEGRPTPIIADMGLQVCATPLLASVYPQLPAGDPSASP